MATQNVDPLYCNNIGSSSTAGLHCCYPNNQNTQICRDIFNDPKVFSYGCGSNCLANCSDTKYIYSSVLQDTTFEGDGSAPIRRYRTCANVPNIAGYLSQNVLEPSISSRVEGYISRDVPDDVLKNITSALTDCLTATCRNARQPDYCSYKCSAVNLITNSTTPNITGINLCLNALCTGREKSLPFADADVVGIGASVFASYIMQCIFIVILWFMFTGFETFNSPRRKPPPNPERMDGSSKEITNDSELHGNGNRISAHQHIFEEFLKEFHKAQCYFSATVQIAALTYGIFDTDMLITFMLIPLATNGVLTVVFTFVLLYRCDNKLDLDVIFLTTVCWFLSSLVFWTLYSHIVPINGEIKSTDKEYRAYEQFYYKLSSLDACGGYSALAVCPSNFSLLGRGSIIRESHKIRVLTPIIWTFSTACLLVVFGAKLFKVQLSKVKLLSRKEGQRDYSPRQTSMTRSNGSIEGELEHNTADEVHPQHTFQSSNDQQHKHQPYSTVNKILYVLVTLCFLAGIGMQLSLLSIATSLHMMDCKDWTFGQVVAVTIWAPPLLSYMYKELAEIGKVKKVRDMEKRS